MSESTVVHVSKPIPMPDTDSGMMGSPGWVDITKWSPEVSATCLTYRGTARTVTIPFASGTIKHIESPPRTSGKDKR